MMLPVDITLVAEPAFRKWVEIYAKDEDKFFKVCSFLVSLVSF
jgi:catalase (peroxidase I)